MPKNSDYSKSFIYKIVCNDINITEIYVGASCDWIKRKAAHKSSCTNEKSRAYNTYVYQFIRQNGGWQNWTMLKICDFVCNNRFERDVEERQFIELLHAELNKAIPTQTQQEYNDTHKETISDHKKEYYQTNKETVKESVKQYYNKNKKTIHERRNEKCVCECGGKYTTTGKSHHNKTTKHQNHIITQETAEI